MRGFFCSKFFKQPRKKADRQDAEDETFVMKLLALRPNVTVFGGCAIVLIFAKVYCKFGQFT